MWKTNVKVMLVGAAVLAFYTTVARIIPQLQSAVPEDLALGSNVTPEELVAAGEKVYNGAGGCTACHGLGTRAPNLLTDQGGEGPIGQRCGTREPGKDCKAYLHEALTNPGAYLVDGFTNIMPDMSRQLSPDQIWAAIAYLESQGGQVTVTASDLASTGGAGGGASGGAGAGGGGAGGASFSNVTDPRQLITVNACIGCHGIDGAQVPIGPSFDGIGSRLTADQIRQAILEPNATVAKGFEQMAGVMPLTFGSTLSAAQLEAIVQFLAARK
jgi:mono/diheme cytochrome c family protein